ncbi:serine-type peptidase [Aureococcus anophagefferens]|nr:serine-type peptidase [Aureococcus anophagefferens]
MASTQALGQAFSRAVGQASGVEAGAATLRAAAADVDVTLSQPDLPGDVVCEARSPSGKTAVFRTRDAGGALEIYERARAAPAVGPKRPRQAPSGDAMVGGVSWNADESLVAFVADGAAALKAEAFAGAFAYREELGEKPDGSTFCYLGGDFKTHDGPVALRIRGEKDDVVPVAAGGADLHVFPGIWGAATLPRDCWVDDATLVLNSLWRARPAASSPRRAATARGLRPRRPHSCAPLAYGGPFLASRGYAVLSPNYRGSTGFGAAALNALPGNVGDLDVRDVVAATEAELENPSLDRDAVAVVGGSHGFLGAWLMAKRPDLYVRVPAEPVTNVAAMVGVTDIPDWCAVEAIDYYRAQAARQDAEMLVYPDDDHALDTPRTTADFFAECARFLDDRLNGDETWKIDAAVSSAASSGDRVEQVVAKAAPRRRRRP